MIHTCRVITRGLLNPEHFCTNKRNRKVVQNHTFSSMTFDTKKIEKKRKVESQIRESGAEKVKGSS